MSEGIPQPENNQDIIEAEFETQGESIPKVEERLEPVAINIPQAEPRPQDQERINKVREELNSLSNPQGPMLHDVWGSDQSLKADKEKRFIDISNLDQPLDEHNPESDEVYDISDKDIPEKSDA